MAQAMAEAENPAAKALARLMAAALFVIVMTLVVTVGFIGVADPAASTGTATTSAAPTATP
jgi:hypothetical protein